MLFTQLKERSSTPSPVGRGRLIWTVYTKESRQEWKSAPRSASTSTVTDMCSTSHFRILWHRLNHCETLWGLSRHCTTSLEASPKRHALFSDTEVQGEDLKLTLKSLSTTRWSCRWEAVKAVYGQITRIVKALLTLSSDKDPKTYPESRALLTAIYDWEFIFGLCLLKVILSNTSSLYRYLQGKTVDVISARRNADMTIQTLRQCRNEESFNSVWQIASAMGLKIKKWLTNSQFELREARVPRQTPSRRLQALVGEHAQRQTQLTPESYHRINTYYASIDKVLSELELRFREMTRKSSVLWEISVTVKHPIKKASPALLSFTTSTARFWKPSRKCTRVFVACAD